MAREKRIVAPNLPLQTTSLWDFPSQNYRGGEGRGKQGDPNYVGATPSYVIWNLLQRYTREKWLVLDPMCGSGTTLDVARDLNRKALGYDVEPSRDDIFRADARTLPFETGKADFVFVDPPYSNHIQYSGKPECIGELDARQGHAYYEAMEKVILEIHRVLKPERHMALYVSDSAKKGHALEPIGFKLFAMLSQLFLCEDIVAVTRHNKSFKRQNWHDAAAEGNFFLRGFNYLFIMYKPAAKGPLPGQPRKKQNVRARDGEAATKKKRGRKKVTGRMVAKDQAKKVTSRSGGSKKASARSASKKTSARGGASKKASSRGGGRKKTSPKRRG